LKKTWKFKWTKSSIKFLEKHPKAKRKIKAKLIKLLKCLKNNKFYECSKRYKIKKLKGKYSGLFRMAIGNYRVIFKFEHKKLVIIVEKVGTRKNFYQ